MRVNADMSKLKVKPIYAVAGLVFVAGVAALVWFLVLAPDAGAAPAADGQPDDTITCEVGQFLTNLADEGSRRLLRLNLVLAVADQRTAKELNAKSSMVKTEVLALLRSKRLAEVEGGAGMTQLAAEIADCLNELLGRPAVVRAYFTDFIIQ